MTLLPVLAAVTTARGEMEVGPILFPEQDATSMSAPGFQGGEAPRLLFAKSAMVGTAQGFTVNTADREAVRSFYNSVFQSPEGLASGWSAAQTAPGTLNANFLEAIRQRVNWYRAMAGAPANVVFLSAYNSGCQQAALMMSRANTLSHSPPSSPNASWPYATTEGATAAGKSNLTLGVGGFEAVGRYMQDSGGNNAETGHRRWMLHPSIQNMGAGSVDAHTISTTTYMSAQALWVNDNNSYLNSWPTVRDIDSGTGRGMVNWPPPGYVPYQEVYPRWSFSLDRQSTANTQIDATTTVTMTKNGAALAVGSITRPVNMGQMMTIVFTPAGYATDADTTYSRPTSDDVYVVTVSGILINNVRRSVSYTVRIFDPAKPGGDETPVVTTGTATPYIGLANTYTHTTKNYATSYQLFTAQGAAYSAVEGAEGGLGDFTPYTAGGYQQRVSTMKDTGSWGFRLGHPGAGREILQWNKMFVPGTGANLTVRSCLRWATASEVARVQISTNGGAGWLDLVDNAGNFPNAGGATPESGFTTATFSLAAYTGRVVMFRFAYDVVGFGSYYPTASSTDTGWFFDNISLSASQVLSNVTTTAISDPAGAANYMPSDSTARLLAVRPVTWTDYPAEIGTPMAVAGIVAPVIPQVWITGSQVTNGQLYLNFTATGLPVTPAWKLMSKAGMENSYQQYTGTASFQVVNLAAGQYRYVLPLPADSSRFFRVEVQ